MIPFGALADIVIVTRNINYVQVDGLDMPIVGELPDREVELIDGSGYTVGAPETYANSFIDGIAWYDVTTDEYMAEGEVFVEGHEYYPMIGLQAKSGYAFVSTSAITGKKVRKHLAMTGEITLHGKVLPVGGIKEKILAAKRAGVTDIMLCYQNRKNIDEIKDIYLKGLTFHYVKNVEEVWDFALK